VRVRRRASSSLRLALPEGGHFSRFLWGVVIGLATFIFFMATPVFIGWFN
jgi:hypothetical protein